MLASPSENYEKIGRATGVFFHLRAVLGAICAASLGTVWAASLGVFFASRSCLRMDGADRSMALLACLIAGRLQDKDSLMEGARRSKKKREEPGGAMSSQEEP